MQSELNQGSLEIIHEHLDWLLCYKPEGINFHTEGEALGLVELAKLQFSMELWPVHRLDKATSGLIVFAKNQSACRELSALFSQRRVSKFYLAVCENTLKKKQGKVTGDMAKARRGSFKLLKTQDNPAITQFISKSLMPGFRLCLLKPKTGKTHQLRVMLKSLGAAIIGDKRYSGKQGDRLYLHAFALQFSYLGEDYEFSVLPQTGSLFRSAQFSDATKEWMTPWDLKWP